MMNGFYQKPRWLQWVWAWIGTALFLAALLGWTAALSRDSLLGGFLLFPLMFAGLFITTPLCRLSGVYRYYSPLLLAYDPNDKKIDLHLGTSFDFMTRFRWSDRGQKARQRVMASVFEGLLAIAEEIESGQRPETASIEATSYFFGERSIRRLGFRLEKPNFFTRLNFALLILEIFACKSFVMGRPALPNIFKLRKATITGAELVANKDKIAAMARRLNKSQ